MASQSEFSGFPEEGIPFMLELRAMQDREWFKAHQGEFNRLWKEPLEQLVAELISRLASTYPRMAEAKPHFFRIQRDTRFSNDKSPYKDFVAVGLPIRPDGTEDRPVPSLYMSFGIDRSFVGTGVWHTSPAVLAKYREALDDAKRGAELQKLVDGLTGKGFDLMSFDMLKRVPKPFPQEHPRAELLKRKGLALGRDISEELMASPELVDFCAESLEQVSPVSRWLERELADSNPG